MVSVIRRMPLLVSVAVSFFSMAPAAAQKLDSTIAIGQSTTLWSAVLQEQRRYFVHLPPHYAQSGKAYPVLYLLDAEMQFHSATGIVQFLSSVNDRIPEMIVVGVTNSDRTRDLTPPITHPSWAKAREEKSGGGANVFLKFLADELIPAIDASYRTQPYRVLVGHSFGGLFSLHTLSNRPDLFQAHIAISPSLWWDDEAPIAAVEEGIRRAGKAPWLFMSWGDNEANIRDTNRKLVNALETKPPSGLRWEHRYYPGEDHMSTPHRSLYDALQALFAGWRMPRMVGDVEQRFDMRGVEAHYSALAARFGFPIAPSPAAFAVAADG
ncbi:alpha/beta hydrolase, partial [Steroidobacter sp.]|uniref:alpha/beta hydrolase n=1 Tax=Steroidobacter sp. TaxID=1978227 RepID=UPI0025D9F9C8